MTMTNTILPLILLTSAVSLGCALPGVDDDAPESVASVAQATVYTPVMDSGFTHSCAGKSDGTLYCWGYNGAGQLGDGTVVDRSTPTLISGVTGAISIGSGDNHTCAVDSTGAVYCWGFNSNGKLGDGTFVDHHTPALVSTATGLSSAVRVAAGYNHNCALKSSGEVMCWGYNGYGELGDGTTTRRLTPAYVMTSLTPPSGVAFTGAVAIDVGYNHSCAVTSGGTVWCWGDNTMGQLGNGLTANSSLPVQVSGITNAVGVAAGLNSTCALLSTGSVNCWGQGTYGELGNGTTTSMQLSPVTVSGITTAVAITAGHTFACALLSSGATQCWGYNGYRNLGDGTTTLRNSPVTVSGLSDGVSIAAGDLFTCALRTAGGMKCWGINNLGELGVGTTTVNTWPVDVLGLP